MLTISRMTNDSVSYYKRLSKYLRGGFGTVDGDDNDFDPGMGGDGAIPMTTRNAFTKWIGGAADNFGLGGRQVQDEHFERLCRGFHPISELPLLQNSGSDRRCPGWDFTWSVPKSVSTAWAAGNQEQKAWIIEAIDEAVEETFSKVEKDLAFCRVGKSGVNLRLEHAKICVATWRDYVNREGEWQLHVHGTLINLGELNYATPKYNALHSTTFYRFKKVLGARFRNNVAKRLIEKGGRIERDGTSFKLLGVPEKLDKANSTRRRQILEECAANGGYNPKLAAAAALKTRKTKKDIPPLPVLEEIYKQNCEDFGFYEEDVKKLFSNPPLEDRPTIYQLVADAEQELLATKSTFKAKELLFASLVIAAPYGYASEEIEKNVGLRLEIEPHLIPISKEAFTTTQQLDKEKRLLDSYEKLKGQTGACVKRSKVLKAVYSDPSYSDEQRNAISELLSNRSRLRLFSGIGGAGKTSTVLNAVYKALSGSGFQVIALAPTGRAATELRDAVPGMRAQTLASGLGEWRREVYEYPLHVLAGLSKEAMRVLPFLPKVSHRKLRKPKLVDVGPKTVVIVDEASAVNIEQHQKLFDAVRKNGGTIILCGDPAQLPPVEGVSPFPYFCKVDEDIATLLTPRRQNTDWQREAVILARDGDPKALELLRDNGCISVSGSTTERQATLLADWTQFGIDEPWRSIVIADTNAEIEVYNTECQRIRIEAGAIDSAGARVQLTDSQTGIRAVAYRGDRVLFTAPCGVAKTGFVGTLTNVSTTSPSSIRLDNGKQIEITHRHLANMRLGYCTTDYRSQGASYENVYVVPGMTAESLFVSLSRHRERLKVFVTTSEVPDLADISASPLASILQANSQPKMAMEEMFTSGTAQYDESAGYQTDSLHDGSCKEDTYKTVYEFENRECSSQPNCEHHVDESRAEDRKSGASADVQMPQSFSTSTEKGGKSGVYSSDVLKQASGIRTAIPNSFFENNSDRVYAREVSGDDRPRKILRPGGPKRANRFSTTSSWVYENLNATFEKTKITMFAFSRFVINTSASVIQLSILLLLTMPRLVGNGMVWIYNSWCAVLERERERRRERERERQRERWEWQSRMNQQPLPYVHQTDWKAVAVNREQQTRDWIPKSQPSSTEPRTSSYSSEQSKWDSGTDCTSSLNTNTPPVSSSFSPPAAFHVNGHYSTSSSPTTSTQNQTTTHIKTIHQETISRNKNANET